MEETPGERERIDRETGRGCQRRHVPVINIAFCRRAN